MNELIPLIITQIICESFPISSAGHMMIAKIFWEYIYKTPIILPKEFDFFLHVPTIFVIIIVLWSRWFPPIRFLFKGLWAQLTNKKVSSHYYTLLKIFFKIVLYGLIVGVIMALFYFFIIEWGERLITPHSEKILTLGLFITMSLLLSLFIKERQKIKYSGGLTLTRAIILGITQGITLLPVGISRFASTYVIFRWLNVSPRRAFEISFLFYFPLVTAGTIKGMFSLYFSHNLAQMLTPTLLSVYFFSGLIALLGFWFMYKIALNKKLSWVGIYMIIPLSIMGFLIFKK